MSKRNFAIVVVVIALMLPFVSCKNNNESENNSGISIVNNEKDGNVKIIETVLEQKFRFKNDDAVKLTVNNILFEQGMIGAVDFKTKLYNKDNMEANIESNIRSVCGQYISIENAKEIANKFVELNEAIEYTVTPTGRKNKIGDEEYTELELKIKAPNIKKINETALSIIDRKLHEKYIKYREYGFKGLDEKNNNESGIMELEKIIRHYDGVNDNFKKNDREDLYTFREVVNSIVYGAYLSAMNDIPYISMNGKINIREVNKDNIKRYVLCTEDNSRFFLNIDKDIWMNMGSANNIPKSKIVGKHEENDVYTTNNISTIRFDKAEIHFNTHKLVLADNKAGSPILTKEEYETKYNESVKENLYFNQKDISIYEDVTISNKTDKDMYIEYKLMDEFGWGYKFNLQMKNESEQIFLPAKSTKKFNLVWKSPRYCEAKDVDRLTFARQSNNIMPYIPKGNVWLEVTVNPSGENRASVAMPIGKFE